MPKKNRSFEVSLRRDKTVRKVTRMYIILGIVIVVITVASTLMQMWVYNHTQEVMQSNLDSMEKVSEIQRNFNDASEQVLLLFSTLDEPEDKKQRTLNDTLSIFDVNFATIEKLSQEYKDMNAESETALERFESAEQHINAYKNRFETERDSLQSMSREEGMTTYNSELLFRKTNVSTMLRASIDLLKKEADVNIENARKIYNTVMIALGVMLAGTIVFLVIIGRSQINAIVEIRRKEQELTEAGNRLTKSRKKLLDSAMTNILTGMKNRYALDESLSQLINNAQFNIAVFDIDNFRMFNDMYGYEFGDEYLVTVAEMLRTEYSEFAEMFNITGNEFCMVFYEHVSDMQAQQLAEQIRQAIGQMMMVGNLQVQCTVSSSLYHYLPSDNLDVNTLLMKMDSALHAAKRDGGNRLYQIQ